MDIQDLWDDEKLSEPVRRKMKAFSRELKSGQDSEKDNRNSIPLVENSANIKEFGEGELSTQ